MATCTSPSLSSLSFKTLWKPSENPLKHLVKTVILNLELAQDWPCFFICMYAWLYRYQSKPNEESPVQHAAWEKIEQVCSPDNPNNPNNPNITLFISTFDFWNHFHSFTTSDIHLLLTSRWADISLIYYAHNNHTYDNPNYPWYDYFIHIYHLRLWYTGVWIRRP